MIYAVLLVVLLIGLPVFLFFRGMRRANGWVYETLRQFFSESLEGHPHQGSFSRILALIGAIILGILGFLLILWIF